MGVKHPAQCLPLDRHPGQGDNVMVMVITAITGNDCDEGNGDGDFKEYVKVEEGQGVQLEGAYFFLLLH